MQKRPFFIPCDLNLITTFRLTRLTLSPFFLCSSPNRGNLPQARGDPLDQLQCLMAHCDRDGAIKNLVEAWFQWDLVEVALGNFC